ncbi:MAG: RnfABCDGE type electron transport complex subunit G [Clostridia bacterium]|nr:RnfABCDGE type electron transport complex subunit G [Clostridia bacterium]
MAAKITKSSVLYVVKICSVLLVITMCVAFLLSFVNAVTKDTIAANEAAQISEALTKLFPGASSPAANELEGEFEESVNGFYEVKDGAETVGYYANVSPVGFKGAVNMMVGLSTDGKVVGVQILSHGETIGIGTKIEDADFLKGFEGKIGSLEYKKGSSGESGFIDGISGATYSSKAVIQGVDHTLKAYAAVKGGA